MDSKTKFFDKYVIAGLKPIPLLPNSKKPVFEGWTKNWDYIKCKAYLEKIPAANLGFLLGDIVDVEGDSVEANKKLNELIGNCTHPTYRGSKSVHHLFINPDPNLTRKCIGEIEFRGFKHQSVLPPSIHPDGTRYHWLDVAGFIFPKMPRKLLEFYQLNKGKKSVPRIKTRAKFQHVKIWCETCGKKQFLHRKRYKLEQIAFLREKLKWMCHNCRVIDVRPACRLIRKELEYISI